MFLICEKANAGTSVIALPLRSLKQRKGGARDYHSHAHHLATPTLEAILHISLRPRERIYTTYTFQISGHSHEFISLGTYVISWEVQSMVPVRVLHTHSSGHAQPSGYCAVPMLRNESTTAISSWYPGCN